MSRYVYKRLFFAPLITCIFLSLTSQALCLLITVFGPSLCVTYEGAPTQKGDFERPQHPNDEDNSTPLGRILSNALDVGDCSGNATQKSRRLCCVACKPGLMSPCICTPMTPPTVGGDVVRAILVCIGVLVYVLATSPLFFFLAFLALPCERRRVQFTRVPLAAACSFCRASRRLMVPMLAAHAFGIFDSRGGEVCRE